MITSLAPCLGCGLYIFTRSGGATLLSCSCETSTDTSTAFCVGSEGFNTRPLVHEPPTLSKKKLARQRSRDDLKEKRRQLRRGELFMKRGSR